MIKTVIFDLDGTLLNTLASLAACYNRVLVQHGFKAHPMDDYRDFIGNGGRSCLTACLEASHELSDLSDTEIDALLHAQRQDYGANWQQDVTIYEGITALLSRLKQKNIHLAVLTNKDHEFALECIGHFFPGETFAVIQGYTRNVPHKPNPIGAKVIAEHFGSHPDEVMLVGDSSMDILTAKAASFHAIGVLWGFRGKAELEQAGADAFINHPQQLDDLIGQN